MLIPIGTDRPRRRPTVVTYALLAANTAVFLAQTLLMRWFPEQADPALNACVFNPAALSPWSPITYQFLHGSMLHIIGNLFFLFIFGPPVEDRLGRWWFAAFYLLGGAAAAGVHATFSDAPVIGASGSIAAVTGAFLVLFPLTHIKVLLFFFIIGVFSIPAWWFIAFAVAKDLWFQSLGGGRVAYAAHLGGYLYGAGVALILLWTKLLPRETYDLFSIGRQAHRRRQYREAVHSQKATPWIGEPGERVRKTPKAAKPAPDDTEAQALVAGRNEIRARLAASDPKAAAARYEVLLDEVADATLPRDAQLSVANQLFASARRESASVAYRLFLERYPSDRETDSIRLMLALTLGRYLNDPIGAKRLLGEIDRSRLTDAYRQLAQTLDSELG